MMYLCFASLIAIGIVAYVKQKLPWKWVIITFFFIIIGTSPLLFERINAGNYLWHIYGWGISEENLSTFLLISIRCIFCFNIIIILNIIHQPNEIIKALKNSHLPNTITNIIELSYRYINILEGTTKNIFIAQKSRLGYVGYNNKLRHTALLIGQTMVISHNNMERMYQGLNSRGYDNKDFSQDDKIDGNISLKNIYFKYENNKQDIIRGISLKINTGEKIIILGENGAGKSTLSLILNGILKPTSGEILINEQNIEHNEKSLRILRRNIGLIFQNSNHQLFNPSVEEEIEFSLRNIGYKKDELSRKLEEIIKKFELEDIRKMPPHLLSEGQKKWVAIISVIATEAQYIIMDEPTNSLDRHYSKKIMELIDDLHQEGKTIIISTHDMNIAYQWADRIIVVHKGEIIEDATPNDVFSNKELLEKANLDRPILWDIYNHSIEKNEEKNEFLPLFLKSSRFNCVIIGGGLGALQKLKTMVKAGIKTKIISTHLCDEMRHFVDINGIKYVEKAYQQEDINGCNIVIAATNDEQLNKDICHYAENNGLLFTSMGDTEIGNFQFGAYFEKEGISISVHTKYQLPKISIEIRNIIETSISLCPESELAKLSEIRQKHIKDNKQNTEYNLKLDEMINKIKL